MLELPSNGGSLYSEPKPMPHNTYCHACKCMPIYTSMTNSSQSINRGIKSEQKSDIFNDVITGVFMLVEHWSSHHHLFFCFL